MANLSLGVRAKIFDKNGKLKRVYDWDGQEYNVKAQIRVRNPNISKIIQEGEWKNCNSFVIQFLEILYNQYSSTNGTITDVDAGEYAWTGTSKMDAVVGVGDTDQGIVVGTGTNAESTTDYTIQTKIGHGSSAGQLLYSTQGHTIPAVVGSNVDYVLTRTFTNDSGSTITIEEAVLYVDEAISSPRCIIRDLITVAIPNTEARVVEFRMRSTAPGFLIQFLEYIYCNMADDGSTTITNTSNGESSGTSDYCFTAKGVSGDATLGIIIGTGTTTPTNTDYVVETIIAHGTGAGQLQYGSQQFTQTAEIGANVDFILTRSFTNGSGSTITIQEICLYLQRYTSAIDICVVRVAKAVTVTDTETVTVELRLRTTV